MVFTDRLAGFPTVLQLAVQQAVRRAGGKTRALVAVEAGIKIHDLDLTLNREPRFFRPMAGDAAPVMAALGLSDTTKLVLPTHGGAGGQSLAGAISTGTHGGDAARGPIGDYVHGMVLVGSGGRLRVLQREAEPGMPRVVDVAALESSLRREGVLADGERVEDVEDPALFHSAIVSVGRFGLVWAYVVELHDETASASVEHRTRSTWSAEKMSLMTSIDDAVRNDDFLQIVLTPLAERGEHEAYVTRHKTVPLGELDVASRRFGIPDRLVGGVPEPMRPVPVRDARRPLPIPQEWCAESLSPELIELIALLNLIAFGLILGAFPFGFVLAIPVLAAADRLRSVGPHYEFGDALADVLNSLTNAGLTSVVELLNRELLRSGQTDRATHVDRNGQSFEGPWLIHGTRAEICDFMDYTTECYKGDSVEIFFAADARLAEKVDLVLAEFARLRDQGFAVGAYVSLRFLAGSSSRLAMATATRSCAIEVSMLRGLEGNTFLLHRLQDIALENGGRVHWGQQNDLTSAEVEAMYGRDLTEWRRHLFALEGRSMLFSKSFTQQRGLEVERPEVWRGWTDLALDLSGGPAVVPAAGRPLEVFGVDQATRRVRAITRPSSGATLPPRPVGPDDEMDDQATPAVVRGRSGRIEVFVRDNQQNLKHTWETLPGGGEYAGWDRKWGPRILGNPSVLAYADGRLSCAAHEREHRRRMLLCWAHWTDGPWNALRPWGDESLSAAPVLAPRRHLESVTVTDQAVAFAPTDVGTPSLHPQRGPRNDSGWDGWRPVSTPGPTTTGPMTAAFVTGAGARLRVFVVDSTGDAWESLDEDRFVSIAFEPWRRLPSTPMEFDLLPGSPLAFAQSTMFWLFARTTTRSVACIPLRPGFGWGGWVDLGGVGDFELAAGALDDGRIEVFSRRPDGRLMARRMIARDEW
jgi:hypothetical protein